MSRKVRGDAKLEQLNDGQRELLNFWLEQNCTYAEVVQLLREEFGLSVAKSVVGVYYRRHIMPGWLLRRNGGANRHRR